MAATGKIVKIGVIVLLIAAAIAVVYYLLRKTISGNKYGTADAVAAGTKGTYGAYSAAYTANDVAPAVEALKGIIPGTYSPGISNAEAYGQAWYKGMNIAFTTETVQRFGSEANKYANNATLRKPNWSVAIGEFLNSTTTA